MEYLLKASIVLIAFYSCYYIFLRKETFFSQNRWFLITGLIISVVFPLVVIPVHITIEPQSVTQQLYAYTDKATVVNEQQAETIDWINLFFNIYIVGLTLFLIQFLFQFGSLLWLLITNPKNKDGIYTYVIVNNKISPFSFFKWIVYNPKSFNEKELQLILTHEKVHASQLHSIDILLTQLACSVFWFNPFIWFYRKNVKQNLEYIADYQTQIKVAESKTYQHLLLKTSIADQQISLSNNFYNSLIKERIVMLQKSRSKQQKQWKYILMLPILAGLLMSMNTETIYVPSEDYMPKEVNVINYNDAKHIEIVFNNTLTDEELENIKKELMSNGITMTINRLKRNKEGLISEINVKFATGNGSANYNASVEDGIKPFYFKVENDGSFGVGPLNKNEVILVEEIHRDHRMNDSKPNVFIFKEGDKDEVIEVIEDSTGLYNIKRKSGNTFIIKENHKVVTGKHKDHDTIRVVTGYRNIPKNDSINVWTIDSSKVEEIKFKSNYFFQENEDEEKDFKVTGKTIKLFSPKTNSANFRFFSNYEAKPLIIINGERMSSDLLMDLNPDQIDSMTVLKGDDATSTYGKEAKNGVIIIKLKDFEKLKGTWTEKTEEDGPWKVTTNVSGYSYSYKFDEENSKDATFGIVTKTTTDNVLQVNKENLEKLGISVKYSKLKRNKSGEITSIKITLKNDKGTQSSASYKDDDGITNVEYGVVGDQLVVRSMD